MPSNVDLHELQKAFALAHKLSNNDETPQPHRNYYRAIAHLIWKSCGDAGFLNPHETAPVADLMRGIKTW